MFYRVKVVKVWWDPVLKRKITRSIGPCEWLEEMAKEARAEKRDRGSWRRGRDLNPGHGLDRPAY